MFSINKSPPSATSGRLRRGAVQLMALMALALGAAGAAQAAIPATERAALIALYNSTDGAHWQDRSNWRNAADDGFNAFGTECSWYGVTCDTNETHVIGLRLHKNKLKGELPSLAAFTQLQLFEINNNQLTGKIPDLAGLKALQVFLVYSNELTGPLPDLAGLSQLKSFYANENQLTGPIPALAGLVNLQVFGVGHNQLTGPIPELKDLKGLQWLSIGNNQLTGPIPALDKLKGLLHFNVSNNQLTGQIPALSGLNQLERFWVHNNQLTGPIPTLSGLNALQGFRVGHNLLTGTPPAAPPNLTAGESRLCPNRLEKPSPSDMAWDTAVGDTWSDGCSATLASHTVTASVDGGNGSVDPHSQQRVSGAKALVFVRPDIGYAYETHTLSPAAACGSGTYNAARMRLEISPITGACTVKVRFKPESTTHTITTTANPTAGGTVTCTPNPVPHGGSSTCAVTANAGYTFVNFSGDCTGTSCTLTGVTSPKRVTAHFYSTHTIPPAERAALIALYNNTDGSRWDDRSNWRNAADDDFNIPGSECSWYGVTCNSAGTHVIGLKLSSNQLKGTLPALAAFTELQAFNVGYNQLSGPIPDLATLLNLQHFDVRFNQLSGEIPDLAVPTKLQTFDVSYNRLSGPIPTSLSNLSQLKEFRVDYNQLSGKPPAAPSNLQAGQSRLCPNRLETSSPTDAAWNAAVGGTWSDGCSATLALHTVDAEVDGGNGSVDPPSQQRVSGARVRLRVTPDAGYKLAQATAGPGCGGIQVDVLYLWAGPLSADCKVTVRFVKNTDPGGHLIRTMIDPEGSGTFWCNPNPVADGGDSTCIARAKPGFVLDLINGCNNSDVMTGTCTLGNVTSDREVMAYFRSTVTVTANVVGGHGSVAPPSRTVNVGDAATFTLTPDAGYVPSPSVGGTCGAGSFSGNDYTVASVSADCRLQFSFQASAPPGPTHTITATANPAAGGTVSCTPNPVPDGGNSTCTATANAGYTFVDFSGDCSGATCTLSGVTAPRTVTANFRQVRANGPVLVPVNSPWVLILLAGLLGLTAVRARMR